LKEISELIIALKPVTVEISVSNRIVSIVDDDPDIAILFYDVLKSIAGITIFNFTDLSRHWNTFTLMKMLMW
jgi:hypothetical protein